MTPASTASTAFTASRKAGVGPGRRAQGFSLIELLVAMSLGLLLWGVVIQTLLGEGQRGDRLVRVVRERGQQRRALALLRGDLLRSRRVELAQGVGAACSLGGREPVLLLHTRQGPITYTVGAPPSAIWRGQVLMRCGPAFDLQGEPSAGAAQNRVLLDGLAPHGLAVAVEPDGLLLLQLRQLFKAEGGGSQRIETTTRVAVPS